ncbi:MAG: FAD:protein FMN transferase [Candidatus Brocadiaceae bacterium]
MNLNNRIIVPFLVVLVSVAPAGGGSADGDQGVQRHHYAAIRMGVQVRTIVYAPDAEAAARACEAVFARIDEIEDVASDYRRTSELMRLCEQAGGPPVPVSDELLLLLTRAQALSARTRGVFDVTAGPYIRLWREARETGQMPAEEALEQAGELVGWEKMRIYREAGTVELLVPGMQLDLGGVAKGYALDEALETLREHGIGSALIEAGGDIVVGDAPPARDGWRIEVANAKPKQRMVVLANAAISTSGDVEQYVEMGGKRYSHIVDPRTGLGLTRRTAATVIAPDGITSDSLATAACVLGKKRGMRLIRSAPGAKGYIRRVRRGR